MISAARCRSLVWTSKVGIGLLFQFGFALFFGFAHLGVAADVRGQVQAGIKAFADNCNADAIALLTAAISTQLAKTDARMANVITIAYWYRGYAHEGLYQYDAAISDYSAAIRRAPRVAGLYSDRGNAYAEINEFDKAYADFDKALKINPKSKEAYALRGDAARYQHRWDAALADANKSIAIDPNYFRPYQVRGRVYVEKNDYAKAIEDFDQVIRLRPNYFQAYTVRAETLYMTGNYEAAANAYRDAVRKFPNSDWPHSGLAWFLSTCPDARWRNGKEAIVEATKACKIAQWRDWENLETLSAAYAESGDFDRAQEYLHRALKADRPGTDARDEKALKRFAATIAAGRPYRVTLWKQPGA